MSSRAAEVLGSFRIVRQPLPSLNIPGCPEAERCLYLRKHRDDPRAIFIANCVPGLTEEAVVEQLGHQLPGVSSVRFGTISAGSTSFALVQLQSEDAVTLVLENADLDLTALVTEPFPEKLGLPGILTAYRDARLGDEALRQWAEDTMREFERQETEKQEELAKRRNVVDDDGFVLVQRGTGKRGRNTVSDPTGATMIAGPSAAEIEKKRLSGRKKQRGTDFLDNFYRFQHREAKQAQVASLRSRFEDDKKRVARVAGNKTSMQR